MGGWATPHVAKCDLYSSSLINLWQRTHSSVFISDRTFLFRICLGIFSQPFRWMQGLYSTLASIVKSQTKERDGTLSTGSVRVDDPNVPVTHAFEC